jgi:hypothetical protein
MRRRARDNIALSETLAVRATRTYMEEENVYICHILKLAPGVWRIWHTTVQLADDRLRSLTGQLPELALDCT